MAEIEHVEGVPEGNVFVSCEYSYIIGEHTRINGHSVFELPSGERVDDHMMKIRVAKEHTGDNSESPIRFVMFSMDFITEEEYRKTVAEYNAVSDIEGQTA